MNGKFNDRAVHHYGLWGGQGFMMRRLTVMNRNSLEISSQIYREILNWFEWEMKIVKLRHAYGLIIQLLGDTRRRHSFCLTTSIEAQTISFCYKLISLYYSMSLFCKLIPQNWKRICDWFPCNYSQSSQKRASHQVTKTFANLRLPANNTRKHWRPRQRTRHIPMNCHIVFQ